MINAFKKVRITFCLLRQYSFYLVLSIFNYMIFHIIFIVLEFPSLLILASLIEKKKLWIPEAQSYYPHAAPMNKESFPCLFNQPYQWEQSPIWKILNSLQSPTLSYTRSACEHVLVLLLYNLASKL